MGKANAEQMAREGALLARHPLLIQKTLADKLSDKVQVIIAPPPADGGFIGSNLLGAPETPTRGKAAGGDRKMILTLAAALAIVVQDHTSLRAAPRSNAAEMTALWQGDVVEIRGDSAGYLKVYDYRRERSGYVKSEAVRSVGLAEADAPALLAVMRFIRERPGPRRLGSATGLRTSRPCRHERSRRSPSPPSPAWRSDWPMSLR